jgi:hypothetical protein
MANTVQFLSQGRFEVSEVEQDVSGQSASIRRHRCGDLAVQCDELLKAIGHLLNADCDFNRRIVTSPDVLPDGGSLGRTDRGSLGLIGRSVLIECQRMTRTQAGHDLGLFGDVGHQQGVTAVPVASRYGVQYGLPASGLEAGQLALGLAEFRQNLRCEWRSRFGSASAERTSYCIEHGHDGYS